jgi:hypothetical protein
MSDTDITVPKAVWETAFAVFAGHVGVEMALYRSGQPMPEVWANVFRFGCDAEALKRLGIPLSPADPPRGDNISPSPLGAAQNANFKRVQVIGKINE